MRQISNWITIAVAACTAIALGQTINPAVTEAAAATAAGLAGGGRPSQEPPEFRADHPFIYMIRHNPTGTILFMGRLSKPGAWHR